MNNINLEKQIIGLIPSQTIKNAIKENNHKFTDEEYVKIVIDFAKSWESRITLLIALKDHLANDNLIAYVNAYVESEMNAYNKFVMNDDGYVYDVDMDIITHLSEKYLCPTFSSVFDVIKNYEENYKDVLNDEDLKHIGIIKRKVSNWDTPQKIDKPKNIKVYLNRNREIRDIYDDNYIYPEDYGLDMDTIKYPTVFKAGDLVYINKEEYYKIARDYSDFYYSISRDKVYGIIGFDQNDLHYGEEVCDCYFLNLSNECVYYRTIVRHDGKYVNYLDCHSHIDFGYIEKVDLNEVHPKIKDDYEYTKSKLIELGIIK